MPPGRILTHLSRRAATDRAATETGDVLIKSPKCLVWNEGALELFVTGSAIPTDVAFLRMS